MKKYISIVFALLLLIVSTVGCENVEYPSGESSTNESGEVSDIYQEIADNLPVLDNNGEPLPERAFKIVTYEQGVFTGSEDTVSTVNKSIVERNMLLKEKYGAGIETVISNYRNAADKLVSSAASGTIYCDMIAFSANDTMRLWSDGLLYDLNSLPNFDLKNDYFDKRISTSLATNETLYLLPDPSTLYYDEIYTMFFNRDLLEAYGCENPETLAMQGKWTWDKFSEIEKSVAVEVNNKATANLHADTFGFASYYGTGTNPLVLWTSCGKKMIDDTYYNDVKFALDVNDATETARYVYSIYNSKSRLPFEGDDARDAFENGRLAFFTNKLEYLNALRDGTAKGSQYGLLPMPKYNEEQKNYASLVSNDALVISVPKALEKQDNAYKSYVSAVVSGICAAGGKTIENAFLSETTVKLLNNNSEAAMLKMTIESATFEFSYVFATQIQAVRLLTTDALCKYIDVGLDIYGSLSDKLPDFEKYADENFNAES